jgi:hypothetical protein
LRFLCVDDNKSREDTELQTINSVHRKGTWVLVVVVLLLPKRAKYMMQIHIRIFVGRNTHANVANRRLPRNLGMGGRELDIV